MIWLCIAVLIALQAADLWTTAHFKDGSADEGNPLMRKLWERFGFWPLIIGKAAVTAGIIAYALVFGGAAALAVLAVAIILMIWVVAGNLGA